MAELVKDRFDLAVSEQGGLARDGGGQVAADQAEVGRALVAAASGDQVVHPCAAPLRFARMPIGVE